MVDSLRLLSPARLIQRDPYVARLLGLLVALLLLFAFVRTDRFTSASTWQSMGVQFPEFGLMALGVMVAMISAGIDLSVVGVANLSAISAASIMLAVAPAGGGSSALGSLLGVGAALVVGALAGVVNGLLVAKVRIPAILATLGTLELFTGLAVVITRGQPISGLPPGYSDFVGGNAFGVIPMPFVIFVIVTVVVGLFLHRMGYGSKLFSVGSNATAAHFSGVNSTWLLVRTYMLSGLCAASAGLVMLGNYNSAKADYGSSYVLLTVLIVVLAGVNPNGGTGTIGGFVVAVVTIQVLSSGLNTFPQISNFYRPLLWGGVLLLVISANEFGDSKVWKRVRGLVRSR